MRQNQEKCFTLLNKKLHIAPTLTLLDFHKTFKLEYDENRVVLM